LLCGVAVLAALFPLTGSTLVSAAAPPDQLDLTTLKEIPVFHNGRPMPLDTFARTAVEVICNRANPTLDLKGNVTAAEFNSEAFAEARRLFPEGKPRKFQAVELVLSWLAEPEKWDNVPFITAKHEDLRKLLGVPIRNEEGDPIAFVSPNQLQDAEAFQLRLEEIMDARREAGSRNEEFKPNAEQKRVEDLWRAFAFYKQLTLSPALDPSARGRFEREFEQVVKSLREIGPNLSMFEQPGAEATAGLKVAEMLSLAEQLHQLSQRGSFTLEEADPIAGQFADATQAMADQFAELNTRLAAGGPPGWDAEQSANARRILGNLAGNARELAVRADALFRALYDNGEELRIVPALNPAALEKDRDTSDESHPWLDLQTLLLGSERAVKDYPSQAVKNVRSAWFALSQTYRDREAKGRSEKFARQSQELALALRVLGEKVEPQRRKLVLKAKDDALIAHTQYPAPNALTNEVRYNGIDPFLWPWVISLCSVFCFGLSFGRVRKAMFWAGLALVGLALAWSVYGFYLRVSITRWAPVTNMYETVIYVPFFVSVLGVWFALLPLTWPSLKRVWTLTGIPDSLNVVKLARGQSDLPPGQLSLANLLMLVPRAALSIVTFFVLAIEPYAAGGRTIINLLPNRDVGATWPGANDLLTWAVGLCVLVPTVWYLPRAILALVGALLVTPFAVSGRLRELMPQVYRQRHFAMAAVFVGFLGWLIAWYGSLGSGSVLNSEFSPLQPVLRDNFWLTIHVLTIVSSYGAGALAWGLGNLALGYYLFGKYRDPAKPEFGEGHRPAGDIDVAPAAIGRRPPEECLTLAHFTYKAMQVAVLLLAAGTILGGLWADVSWGRFWGWDPKEVWALISLLVYLAILHGRYAGLFGNFGLAVGSVLGATAIAMSWYGVNFVLGAGLHSYGFGDSAQGQWYVAGVIAVNWLFMIAAAMRYLVETSAGAERASSVASVEESHASVR
jgi:ABC-type transport system involved in cytochrome c biogenesis permease subunit